MVSNITIFAFSCNIYISVHEQNPLPAPFSSCRPPQDVRFTKQTFTHPVSHKEMCTPTRFIKGSQSHELLRLQVSSRITVANKHVQVL